MGELRFSGQVAVVTGGASGLGEGIARRLGAEGAAIALIDQQGDRLGAAAKRFADAGMTCLGYAADICDEAQVAGVMERVNHELGVPDILVNSAGIVGPTSTPITAYAVEDFEKVLRVNLIGSFVMTKAVLPGMVKKNYGRILLIASIAGKEGNPGMCGYSASKAGVIGLVKGVGKEYAETGITVNGLAPAVVMTDLVRGIDPKQVAYMTAKIPMKRLGAIEEVASMAAWIVSRECSFTTGFVFDLTGGRATY